jgi:glucose-6-phosphate isomerase
MVDLLRVKSPFALLSIGENLRISAEGFNADEGKRTLRDLAVVLRGHPEPKLPKGTLLYRMYRSFIRSSNADLFKARNLRHDITIMASLVIGSEQNKTLGHYHPVASGDLTYPEVYHILHGQATYLLQREEGGEVTDFVYVEAMQGEALLIPPNYGHVTVNTGEGPLVMANLVSDRFASLYSGYVKMGGAAYYLLEDGTLEANNHYGSLPKPRKVVPNFKVSKDLYEDFLSCPSCFAYLNEPMKLGGLGRL